MNAPLASLDEWEDDLRRRYPEPPVATSGPLVETASASEPLAATAFRDYRAEAKPGVKEFYRLNHKHQTLDFVRQKRAQYVPLARRTMGAWEALEFLNTLVDDSDPDTDLSQLEHLLQTAEAIRQDGHPEWFVVTGLIHDLGKILCLFGEPQWAVVGDTFPVGCAYSPAIVFAEFFAENPDYARPEYQTPLGIYEPPGEADCGLDRVLMSWGHDEYLYHVVREYLPDEALYMIRYHSFYPAHREGAYNHLMNDRDRELFHWVRAFNPYDLYTKRDERPNVEKLKPYYQDLLARFFPRPLRW